LITAMALVMSTACGSPEKRPPDRPRPSPTAAIDQIKPISGTFFNFQWPDERYKYMNERQIAFTCDEWAIKVAEMSEIGIHYIVIQSVAMQGRAFYRSESMPGAGLACDDPLGTVMRAAEKLGIKVFLSCEFVKNEDDDICDPQLMEGRLDIMREIAARFGASSAFFGWYFASEGDASDLFDPRYVEYVNRLAAEARKLTPEAKMLIAPSRSRYVQWDEDFPRQLESMDIDIIAYQDKVACLPYLNPIGASRTQFALARSMHDRVPRIALWADIETFTWEGKNDSRLSALVPAPFPRVLEQMAAVSSSVDRIIAFTMQGMADEPGSPAPTGPPSAAELYGQYKRFIDREPDMVVLADAIAGHVQHAAIGARVILRSIAEGPDRGFELVDGGTASMYNRKNGWIEFEDGALDITVDLGRDMKLDYIGIHMLADRWNKVLLPRKVSFSVSLDGTEYASIGSIEPYPWCPTAYDVRREIVTAPPVETKARYVRIESEGLLVPERAAPAKAVMLVSEIIINPEMHGVRASGSAGAPSR
jgi:hypothetical protein